MSKTQGGVKLREHGESKEDLPHNKPGSQKGWSPGWDKIKTVLVKIEM